MNTEIDVFTTEEWAVILEKADEWLEDASHAESEPNGHERRRLLAKRRAAIFAWVASALGVRPSEAVRIRWEEIDLIGGKIRVWRHKRYGRNWTRGVPLSGGEREIVPIPKQLRARLEPLWRPGGRLLAPVTPADYRSARTEANRVRSMTHCIDRQWSHLLKLCRIRHRRKYQIRHTILTATQRRTRDILRVQTLAGHKSIQSTMPYLRHVEREDINQDVEAVLPLSS